MAVPWSKKLSGRAEVLHFPVTNGPIMLLKPNRAGVPIYGQPRDTVVFMQPPPSALPPLPPPPAPPRPPVPPLTVIFYNAARTCTDTCPVGTVGEPISVTVQAGEYSSIISQEAANDAAQAAACAQVMALRELTPCEVGGNMEFVFSSIFRECVLCGFAEFTSPSTPPKLYTICEFSGGTFGVHYDVSGTFGNPVPWQCEDGVQNGTNTTTLSGRARLDNCVVVETALEQVVQEPGPDFDVHYSAPSNPPPSCNYTIVDTPTTRTITGTGACCITSVDAFGFPFGAFILTGTILQVLSVEDTEANAIARATPVPGAANVAFYEPRVAFDFEYQTVELDIAMSDLTTGLTYRVTIEITTEDYGGGNPVVSQLTFDFTASGPTHNINQEFIPDRGKQVTVGNPTFEIL